MGRRTGVVCEAVTTFRVVCAAKGVFVAEGLRLPVLTPENPEALKS